MAELLKQLNNGIYVNTFALEVYLPFDYTEKAYRGNSYYSILGSKVRFFCVGNMRFYDSQKQMDNPMSVKCYPLGFPMMVHSQPTEIDTREVQFSKGGPIRKCIVLTYYKGDALIENCNCIKNSDNAMIVLSRLEGGKFNHISPMVANGILSDVQSMNGVKLRIPTEVEEIFVAERYRDPANPAQKARFAEKLPADDSYITYNMRQDAMKTTTYQAITHEDINTSLIAAINRKEDGIVDEATIMERIVRGLDMSDLIEERDARLDAEESENNG